MTIGHEEAAAWNEGISPVPREAAERVLNYLVFHRSLIGEKEDSPAFLERYLSLVRELKDGVHVVIPDPQQRATALLFELVLENEFDPWEIDLVRFTEVYLERVKDGSGINFAVAGKLLYMAWNILYLQSQEILTQRDQPAESEDGAFQDGGPIDDGYLSDLTTPEAIDVTTAVLDTTGAPALVPLISHAETRPVTLLELVQAFGQAEQDARQALHVEELRERLREQQRSPPEILVHGDIPQRDLADAWEIVRSHPKGEAFNFLDLWRPEQGRDHLVALFLAALFLARERAIDFLQESIGESPLLLVRREDVRPAPSGA
ncbi:MAG: segregation/condensation protein A [Thermoplasmata archaeon]